MISFNNDKFIQELTHDTNFKISFIDLVQCIINEHSELNKYSYLSQLKTMLEQKELLTEEDNIEDESYSETGIDVKKIVNDLENVLNIENLTVEIDATSDNINSNFIVSKNYSQFVMPTKTSDQYNQNIQEIICKFNEIYGNNASTNKLKEEQAKKTTTDEKLDIYIPNQYVNKDELLNNQLEVNINKIRWISQQSVKIIKEEVIKGNPEKTGKLKQYANNIVAEKDILNLEDLSLFNKIEEQVPNFAEVIKFYKGNFILNNSRRKQENVYIVPTPILLLGDPGIGKTYFAQILAKELGTHFHFFDSNSITASWVLTGSSGQWRDADAGYIFKILLESNTVSPIVIFDEIDKLSSGKNYDPYSTFHQLLEPTNAKMFQDEFLNVKFDASNMIFILTANNIENIPKSLLSRMKIFNVKKASPEHTRKIAQNIYSDIIGKSDLLNPILTENNLKTLENLVPRDIKKILKDSVFNQVTQTENTTHNDLIIRLDGDHYTKWGF